MMSHGTAQQLISLSILRHVRGLRRSAHGRSPQHRGNAVRRHPETGKPPGAGGHRQEEEAEAKWTRRDGRVCRFAGGRAIRADRLGERLRRAPPRRFGCRRRGNGRRRVLSPSITGKQQLVTSFQSKERAIGSLLVSRTGGQLIRSPCDGVPQATAGRWTGESVCVFSTGEGEKVGVGGAAPRRGERSRA